jgi:glutathione S-transferase
MSQHLYPALATCLAMLVYAWTIFLCGRARGAYGVKAPAVTGHPEFEKRLRAQQNTLEQLMLFVPSLWVFSLAVSPFWGGIVGLVFVGGRILYVASYIRDPASRGAGFVIGALAVAILLLGGLAGVLKIMITGLP